MSILQFPACPRNHESYYMSVQIDILSMAPGKELDTFTSAKIVVCLTNRTDGQIIVDHWETRVFLELRSMQDQVLLVIDEALRMNMLFGYKLRKSPDPFPVGPGEQVLREFDLANYYYPFAQGVYRLVPCFVSPGKDRVEGPGVEFSVEPLQVKQCLEWYENPIFGTHSLLSVVSTGEGEDGRAHLRWLGLNQPCASFFNTSLKGVPGGCIGIPSVAAFFDVEDIEPGFEKVLLWQKPDDKISITRFLNGVSSGLPREVQLPPGCWLLPYSFRTENQVFIFSMTQGGPQKIIRGYRIDFTRPYPAKVLEYAVPKAVEHVAVGGGPDTIHLVTAGSALEYLIFSHHGELVKTSAIGSYEGYPIHLFVDLVADVIRASYVDPGVPGIITLVESQFPTYDGPPVVPQTARLRVKLEDQERIVELDSLFSKYRVPHLLYATDKGRLLISSPGETHALASSDARFFPRLLQGDMETEQLFIGFFLPHRGYRFYDTAVADPWNHMKTMKI